jgi:membrane protease YdiL (CAAX protease family)
VLSLIGLADALVGVWSGYWETEECVADVYLHDGVVRFVAEVLWVLPAIWLLRRVIRNRSPWSVREVWPLTAAWKPLVAAIAVLAVSHVLFGLLGYLVTHENFPKYMIDSAKVARGQWLVVLIACVIGPAFEELLFRGFVFKGLQESRVGPVGAVVLTAFFWAVFHPMYHPFLMVLIFVDGLILGVIRWKSGSLVPGVLYHCLGNVLVAVNLYLCLRQAAS